MITDFTSRTKHPVQVRTVETRQRTYGHFFLEGVIAGTLDFMNASTTHPLSMHTIWAHQSSQVQLLLKSPKLRFQSNLYYYKVCLCYTFWKEGHQRTDLLEHLSEVHQRKFQMALWFPRWKGWQKCKLLALNGKEEHRKLKCSLGEIKTKNKGKEI